MSTDIFMQGLSLSILGILFTFSALGLFILVILLLQRLFPAEAEQEAAAEDVVEVHIDTLQSEEQEIAAAIAVAIQQVRTRRQSQLGSALEAGRGYWWKRNQS